ncbi:SEL1L [Symbiodinium sp. KB8]|nr:SEL1L [Symbiodinium sp. KB8]
MVDQLELPPGLVYYQHESGQTQFERPSSRSSKDPLEKIIEKEKRQKAEEEKKEANKLPERAVQKGEARIWHILKKHRDFFGKPAKSWRQSQITWSKKEAKESLKALKFKLENVAYGGGAQALQKKFENYAKAESDDDISAKVGGDLGPITKKKKLFGGYEIAKASFELKIGTISDVLETSEGATLMLLRVLLISLALLATIYFLKAVLLQLTSDDAIDEADSALSGQNNSWTDVERALQAFRSGDDSKALAILTGCLTNEDSAEADQLETAACKNSLGELHWVGAGVDRNLTRAKELFEEAAAVGEPDAQYNLAILYASTESSDDLRRNEALAVLHLYAASTAGHPGALMAMGYRHLHGYGVPQACTTAALNYIDVAKGIASIYSSGMPQAVELVRLNLPQKDRKVMSSSELNLFVQIATSGDSAVAAAIGKRYLLGIEGFKQDYQKAKQYLKMAANRQHSGALALLGYMYCLGLGTPQNLETAYAYFVTAASSNDPLGHNGLGYIYFRGTNAQARNLRLAFKHFNESAFGGSSDGMFNLASMYLTGSGTEQSFQKAVLYYTQALDRGHTPAAYSLAVMHLNGIGTVRDCDIAVNLLKKVCERGEWVSSKLVSAYDFSEKQPDKAALMFLKLAEAGHEVSQMNAAHLFDHGHASLLTPDPPAQRTARHDDFFWEDSPRLPGQNVAQRFYELSAEQGSASSELRLGDYAYYGWGMTARFTEAPLPSEEAKPAELDQPGDGGWEDFPLPSIYTNDKVELHPQPVDYEAALARYRKTADMTVTGEWMQSFVARASFNLGFMHQFGIGIVQDLNMAKQHYFRCREVDPSGLHAPVTMALAALAGHVLYLRLPSQEEMIKRLSADVRLHVLFLHIVAVIILAWLHCILSSRRRTAPPRPHRQDQASPPAATQPALGERQGSLAQTAGESRRAAGNVVLD